MPVDLGLQLGHALVQVGQGSLVALGQLFDAPGELLADTVGFAVDGGFQGSHPLVVHHQGFHVGLAKLGILRVGFVVEAGLGFFDAFLPVTFLGVRLQPGFQGLGFGLRFRVAFDFLQALGHVGLVDLVQLGEGTFLATVLFLQLGQLGGSGLQAYSQPANAPARA